LGLVGGGWRHGPRAGRRAAAARLPRPGRPRAWSRAGHRRGTRDRWAARSPPDPVRRARRRAVRLLHARNVARREGALGGAPGTDGGRGAGGAVGQSVPLHRLHEDRRGRPGGGAGPEVGMRLHPFRLVEPESLTEALDAVARLDGEARLVAGGTAIVPMIRLGLVKPDRLGSLERPPPPTARRRRATAPAARG